MSKYVILNKGDINIGVPQNNNKVIKLYCKEGFEIVGRVSKKLLGVSCNDIVSITFIVKRR